MHSKSETTGDRTRRFIETTLGQDAGDVASRLSSRRVSILLDDEYAGGLNGQIVTFMLLNLLVRLDEYCPVIHLVVPEAVRHSLLRLLPQGPLDPALLEFFSPFPAASRLQLATSPGHTPRADISIAVTPRSTPATLRVWADGWIAYINEDVPAGPWKENAVGASVAAALAACETFKRLILDLSLPPGLRVLPCDRLVFSAYDYSLQAGDNPPLPAAVDVDGVVVVGLGGIGSALVAAASCLPALTGRPILVDGDELDDTNLNRHLVSRPGDRGHKVDLCRRALAFHPDIEPRPESFKKFVTARGERHELVVVGVDHDRVRREVQDTLPRVLLNAGTSDMASFRVTCHTYTRGACLSCIARNDLLRSPAERVLASRLGLDLDTLLSYERSGTPVPAQLLQEGGVLSDREIAQLAGHPMDEIRRRVCAELILGTDAEEQAVSISFLSAIPGFLLLGEVIKERGYPGTSRPALNDEINHTFMSVLGRPNEALLRGRRDKLEDCSCTRTPYQRAYARRWLDNVNRASL